MPQISDSGLRNQSPRNDFFNFIRLIEALPLAVVTSGIQTPAPDIQRTAVEILSRMISSGNFFTDIGKATPPLMRQLDPEALYIHQAYFTEICNVDWLRERLEEEFHPSREAVDLIRAVAVDMRVVSLEALEQNDFVYRVNRPEGYKATLGYLNGIIDPSSKPPVQDQSVNDSFVNVLFNYGLFSDTQQRVVLDVIASEEKSLEKFAAHPAARSIITSVFGADDKNASAETLRLAISNRPQNPGMLAQIPRSVFANIILDDRIFTPTQQVLLLDMIVSETASTAMLARDPALFAILNKFSDPLFHPRGPDAAVHALLTPYHAGYDEKLIDYLKHEKAEATAELVKQFSPQLRQRLEGGGSSDFEKPHGEEKSYHQLGKIKARRNHGPII